MSSFNKKSLILIFILFLHIIFLPACKEHSSGANSKIKGKKKIILRVTGAFALYPLMENWAGHYEKINPKIKIFVTPGSATKGNAAVVFKRADIGMFSKNIDLLQYKDSLIWFEVAKNAILPIINSENPVIDFIKRNGITEENLTNVFVTEKINKWSELYKTNNNKNINCYTRSDLCGAGEIFAEFSETSQQNINGIGVYGDPGMISAIRNDMYGIGYCNFRFAYNIYTNKLNKEIEVFPLDINNNGVIDTDENIYSDFSDFRKSIKSINGSFPIQSGLYLLINKNSNNKFVMKFLNWILTEGQKYVEEAGYVPANKSIIKDDILKLSE